MDAELDELASGHEVTDLSGSNELDHELDDLLTSSPAVSSAPTRLCAAPPALVDDALQFVEGSKHTNIPHWH